MLSRGDSFGSYRIVARLKAGGMARLYLARREGALGFSRPVALKVIHRHLAKQPEFVQMFIDEATLSAKIHDPNVVHVEDLGRFDDTLFLAMEYVHGVSLSRLLEAVRRAGRRLSPVFVAYLAAEAASGLHAAHETSDEAGRPLGIVHRDVSPHNLLVSYRGHVKVIDFGVAKALRKSHETQDGSIQGKLAYMPPEQANSRPVDRRADVYALGIVLWEMIVGRRLFSAELDIALLQQVRDPKVTAPSDHVPEVPPALDAVVMALLQRRPEDRPATALEVKRMLLDAVPGARSVEGEDVAALVRALLADQIAREDAVLASIDDDAPPEPRDDRVFTSELEGRPTASDASRSLDRLTIPLAVVADEPPATGRARSPRTPWIVAGASAVLLAVTAAFVLARSPTDALTAEAEAPPAVEPAPLDPADPSAGDLAPREGEELASEEPKRGADAATSPPAAPGEKRHAHVKKRAPATGRPAHRPKATSTAPAPRASASSKTPRTVGGVELYGE